MSKSPIVYVQRGKAALAQMALEQGLFHQRGVMKDAFAHAAQHPRNYCIVAAMHAQRMIGVCLIDPHNNINCFVKPSYRRRGLGSALVERARSQWMERTGREECELTSYHGHNVKESLAFWRQNAVLNINDQTGLSKEDVKIMSNPDVNFQAYLLERNRKKYQRLKEQMG